MEELPPRDGRTAGIGAPAAASSLTPQAYRLFQGKLLERIFSDLQAARTGRHHRADRGRGGGRDAADQAYEFGDSITHMDIPQSLINALLRGGRERR
jgi:uncharacterized protein with von Willebrand factor type A (vWA) domain